MRRGWRERERERRREREGGRRPSGLVLLCCAAVDREGRGAALRREK
jgi:hypothetical protein